LFLATSQRNINSLMKMPGGSCLMDHTGRPGIAMNEVAGCRRSVPGPGLTIMGGIDRQTLGV
jgi:hypothetical protein